jgi:hypothetical protein
MKKSIWITAAIAGIIVASVATIFVSITPSSNPIGNFLGVKAATISPTESGLEAKLVTHGFIPQDGKYGAFGYGILTSVGLDGVIVATTHAGVLDSEMQQSASDPIWHSHFVSLGTGHKLCNGNPNVTDITYESPSTINVNQNNINFDKIPSTFTGTNPLTNKQTTIAPGNDAQSIVSFTLAPKFDNAGQLQAVCVENITPTEKFDTS